MESERAWEERRSESEGKGEGLSDAPQEPLPSPMGFPADEGVEEAATEGEPSVPRRKPLLARLLNAVGIPTSPGVEWVLDWLQVIAIAGVLAWAVMTYGVVRMRVPTGSMEPTIMPGDSFFVDKFTYRVGLNKPEPGDIIVFWHTERNRPCVRSFLVFQRVENPPCRERYVKRLIAVGPATVTIKQGKIYINGQLMTDPAFQRDYLCSNAYAQDPRLPANECSWTVPEGKFFVLGDNTRNSSDSRYWGFVDARDFIGEPFFRVWPPDRIGPMNGYFGSPR